jgi:hypothetical protein
MVKQTGSVFNVSSTAFLKLQDLKVFHRTAVKIFCMHLHRVSLTDLPLMMGKRFEVHLI